MKIEDHPAFKKGNFKVRCIKHLTDSEANNRHFTIGGVYEVIGGHLVSDTGFDFVSWSETGNTFENFKRWFRPYHEFELVTEPDLPRICYVLGGEKTPLNNREEFVWSGITYRVNDGHVEYKAADMWHDMAAQLALENMINNISAIIRRPQFSEDEKALMRLLIKNRFFFISRDKDENLYAFEGEPERAKECFVGTGNIGHLPFELFSQITWDNSPFDVAAYLESEESK